MFSYLSNLVWGAQEETDVADASEDLEVEHSIHEEAGDWIVVTTGTDQPKEQSKSGESIDSGVRSNTWAIEVRDEVSACSCSSRMIRYVCLILMSISDRCNQSGE